MPELPDVEAFRRVLAQHAMDKPIQQVDVIDAQVLHGATAREWEEHLPCRAFGKPARHGKWLIVPVTGADPVVLLHFGMTGSLGWVAGHGDRHRHDRVVFSFPDGELRYRDIRKLRGLWLARNQDQAKDILADLGPDALAVSRDELRELLAAKRRQVKAALTDQSVIAGLGNLLADEILWRAKINPRRSCDQLTSVDFTRLHARMCVVLRLSVKAGCVPRRKSWLTGRRDDESGSCPRCGTTLAHGRVGGRGTVWCPQCQAK
jgi:formamidopyrimidine-DNA glycosylase